MQRKNIQTRTTLLYVDDDEECLEGLKTAFCHEYNVHLARSASEAISILERTPVHVLITEERIPEVSGCEMLGTIADRYPDLLRFLLTGCRDFDPLLTAIRKGWLQGIFLKPLDAGLLRRRIKKLLGARFPAGEKEKSQAAPACVRIYDAPAKQPGIMSDWFTNAYPFRNADDVVVEGNGSVVAITGMRQAEKAAEEARGFAEKLLQTANVMIVCLDNNGRIQLVNPMVQTLTGYSYDELIGQNWFDRLVPKEVYPHVWDEFNRLLKGGLPGAFENPILTKSGDERIISWRNSELTQNGTIVGTLSVGIDISQRKAAEKEKDLLSVQLRRAQKMEAIGTLAGGIAHDFNNILSPIIGYAEIIISDADPGSSIRDCAQEILKAGVRARDLTYQILTFSREKEQEKNPVRIQPVIKEALKLLRASLPSSIKLNQRIDNECGPIHGDTTQIYQVIMNLCTNAYQALKNQKGHIEVVVEPVELTTEDKPQFMELKPGRYVRISVSDNGPGIDPNIIERIFEPYFTTKRMKSGTGLGLSVVHGIVKSHGGALKVYSEPGKGTTFNVYLPRLARVPSEAVVDQSESIVGGSESILLVDDEEAIVSVVQRTLKRLGYEVTAFTDPRDAVSEFKAHPGAYQLVISDMTMPHMTGLQLAKAIRDGKPKQPIVICTGFSDMINRNRAGQAGVRKLLMKPLVQGELAKTVRAVLDEMND